MIRRAFLVLAAACALHLCVSCNLPANSAPGTTEIPIIEEDGAPTIIHTGLQANANVVFVKLEDNPPALADGKTWATAFHTIEGALMAHKNDADLTLVVAGNEHMIKKKSGAYQWIILSIFSGSKLAIFGGFKGDETDLTKIEAKGDFPSHPLVLVGDHSQRIFEGDFSLRPGSTVKLFGIAFKNGGVGSGQTGGALSLRKATLELAYTKWIGNKADGGAAIFAEECPITIVGKSAFSKNLSTTSGGAVIAINSPITIKAQVIFSGNEAEAGNGGALRLFDSPLTINETVAFSGNKAATGGSAFSSNRPLLGDPSKIHGATKKSGSEDWEQN